ncbi:hypothetical protein ANCCEY_06576 [Ancylostoma ceylanicum]|uniref:Ral GTPase-activating protein subunit alpha/beta N-terminal domain-containing protein n=1 Tax=Ancylostoma ceylanicum TaxID=53326 RepID=A0A0D6LW66_9BILA|nr:hypothetical protein ANCCEY_06576 [Ancylostoma ceylanicum]
MEQIVSILKEALEPIGGVGETISGGAGQRPVLGPEPPAMYEEWPTLEFPDLTKSILDLFTKATSESVSSSLLFELTRSDSEDSDQASIRLQTDDQLRWCMQVLNHSLTLSFYTHREYETVRGAVRIYLHWLRALTDIPDGNIPRPLLDTPEKYFRNIIDALRNLFCRRGEAKGEVPRGLAIERQAREVETVLDAIRALTHSASRKYQNEVWARTLSFLLNSADLLLADPLSPEEMGMRVGSRVVDTLFDLWFHAVLNEEIPSPTYWRTLAALCRRWRHHTMKAFCRLPTYPQWRKKMRLTYFITVDGGIPSNGENTDVQPPASLPLCFFLATTALQRMIDVFYGDGRVPIEFKESDILVRKWNMATPTPQPSVASADQTSRPRSDYSREKSLTVVDSTATSRNTGDTDGTLTHDGRASFSSSTSGKEGRSLSDMAKRSVKTRQSDRTHHHDDMSGTTMSTSQHLSAGTVSRHTQDQVSPATSKLGESVSQGRVLDAKQSVASAESSSRPLAVHFVAHTLAVNPAYIPWVGEKGPKAERLLSLTMDWLLAAARAKTEHKGKAEVADDDCLHIKQLRELSAVSDLVFEMIAYILNSYVNCPPSATSFLSIWKGEETAR